MKLESTGILLSMRPLGERDCVAHIFTDDFGVLCGMLRGAQVAKKNKPLIGQLGSVSWNARLDSQLGTFYWEAEKNLVAKLMMTKDALAYMNSAFALLVALLPEREQYHNLYVTTLKLLDSLAAENPYAEYTFWEVDLLSELGYALNLESCSGCGTHEGLEYLSPRTGRAVCVKCAEPYKNRLYKLPVSLGVTRCFLERACMTQGTELPPARIFLDKFC